MSAKYLVDLGIVSIYFDDELKRCPPPVIDFDDMITPTAFVYVPIAGELLSHAWDQSLAQFTRAQRARAALYQRSNGDRSSLN